MIWQTSGYNLAGYCHHHHLVYHQLIYWKTKFASEQTKPVSFVPVPLQTEPPDTSLTLRLQDNRFQIEIGSGFSDKMLSRLITTLESLQISVRR